MDIGIIAEEYSDVDVMYELTSKLVATRHFSFKKFVGHGCGKSRRKCKAWAKNLFMRGCTHIIILHDLDDFVEQELRRELEGYVADIGYERYVILIPIYELESWLLADDVALRKSFNMKTLPRLPNSPERIKNPKEKLRDIVWKYTNKYYDNTIHNQRIAKNLSITKLKIKCRSFTPYPKFISNIFP